MSNRIDRPNQELLSKIFIGWTATIPRMFDQERTVDSCMATLADPSTHWYVIPRGFLILRGVMPGAAATICTITEDGKAFDNLNETQAVLSEAFHEFKLRRASLIAPSGTDWRDYKLLGFQHEGRVRRAALFNNEWTDAELLGVLEHEVGKSHRRKRPRYRPNKKVRNNGRS